jgi:hypothetical protein
MSTYLNPMRSRGFKALKQSTKLLFLTLHRPNDALKSYMRLLTYTKSTVTRNYAEKTINGILDYVGGGKGGPVEVMVLERFYQATKDALREARNEVCFSIRTLYSYRLNAPTSDCPQKPI